METKPTSKYERGTGVHKKRGPQAKDRVLNAKLKKIDRQYKDAVTAAARTDMLLQEEQGFMEADGPMEKTYRYKQDDISDAVDVSTANKKFDLTLNEFGPYTIDYTRNGRKLLIGGKKGHVASIDWKLGKIDCELHLNETVHAVKYFHNDQYFAAAQKKYTFVYDKDGIELHRLKRHIEVTLLDFLPYHFLLTTAGHSPMLRFHDVSTGDMVSEFKTKMGPTQAMKQNPWNAVMHLGHGNGVVSLWSPSMSTPLVKIQATRGPVRDLAIDREGRYMAVAGADKTIKIWDIRKFEEMETYYSPTPASSLDISDTGLLSVGWGPHITVWKDIFKTGRQREPYMTHLIPGSRTEKVKFAPFEDILGIGHQKGFSSIIVPGAGEANYDAMELNPYESAKQRQQQEVHQLLNKISPDTITLDPNELGLVDKKASSIRLKSSENGGTEVKNVDVLEKTAVRPDIPAKNSALRKFMRKKRQNVIDERRMRVERNWQLEQEARKRIREGGQAEEEKEAVDQALDRFR